MNAPVRETAAQILREGRPSQNRIIPVAILLIGSRSFLRGNISQDELPRPCPSGIVADAEIGQFSRPGLPLSHLVTGPFSRFSQSASPAYEA